MSYKIGDKVKFLETCVCIIVSLPDPKKYPNFPDHYELDIGEGRGTGLYRPSDFRKLTPLEELL